MKILTLLGVVAFLCVNTNAQQQNIRPLSINERLPNLTIHNLLNYTNTTTTIDNLQCQNTKMILLDFWFTHCIPCIKQIPKLDSLQREFKDQLQILMVTFEPDSLVAPFIAKWEQLHKRKLSIPIVTADKQLQAYFNQVSRPNYAWIATDRVNMGYVSTAFIAAPIIEQVLKKMQEEVHLRGYLRRKLK
ncbi:MAG TPA: redoxin family protein [Niabella sp.]|nr:redoxin family protein [Niabella sp.]